ncbi:hypothetical protein [Silvanigrella sp.]|uniref:hypothetical protein n=1 Tax=Silvanigrella sp. TaxID=2024976 RepID=UPI0037CB16FA
MNKMNLIKTCIAFLGSSVSIYSYANCPSISEIEANEDGTHIARTEKGNWTQFINYQAYKNSNNNTRSLGYYFVFGLRRIDETNYFNQVVCIYRLLEEDNQYIVLLSPIDNKYEISIPKEFKNSNEWRIIQPSRAVCVPDASLDQNINIINQCEFKEMQ